MLDNQGGIGHAGRTIALHFDGSYADTKYTDVPGDERTYRGVYTLNPEKTQLMLSPKKGERELLYRVDYDHKQYWVHEDERHQITKPGEGWLREISLRADIT